jgi:hypothetical protein
MIRQRCMTGDPGIYSATQKWRRLRWMILLRWSRVTRSSPCARGPRAVDPTREYVDGGHIREPITEGQRKAVLRLNRAQRELGADGSALVHEVLILGMTTEQIGQRRGLHAQRWNDYFARRFRECLDRLALMYGFATERR